MNQAGWLLTGLAIGLPTIVYAQPSLISLIPIDRIVVQGSTVFPESTFTDLTRPLWQQSVTIGQLQGLVTKINQYYQERGYITSRAILSPQNIAAGVVTITIIEGKLEKINIRRTANSPHRLIDAYILDRVELGITNPLNFARLEEELQKLRANPLIADIQANLVASSQEGMSILEVLLTEAPSFQTGISTDNYGNPATGIYRGNVTVEEQNLLGLGDRIVGSYTRSGTADNFSGLYTLPLNPQGGSLSFLAQGGVNPITEGNFQFNLQTDSRIFELNYRQPLFQTAREELTLSFAVGLEQSRILIDGDLFQDGDSRSTVVRFGQEYVSRDPDGGWFISSRIGVGLDALGATVRSGSPDGRFWVWNGQVLRLQRFSQDSQTLAQFRLNFQYGGDTLPALNRFSLGGPFSVRGYRQGLVTADSGVQGSVEFQVPIARNHEGKSIVQVLPFLEGGAVWNQDGGTGQTLLGTGIGIGWQASKNFTFRLDYGIPLIPAQNPSNTLQDAGLYFSISGSF